MDILSSKGVRITGSGIKFTGHSHTPQRRCSDSYWSIGPVMNNLLLDLTNFYWTLTHVWQTLGMTALPTWYILFYAEDAKFVSPARHDQQWVGQIVLRTDTRLVFCNRKLSRTDNFFTRTMKPICNYVNPALCTEFVYFTLRTELVYFTLHSELLYFTLHTELV